MIQDIAPKQFWCEYRELLPEDDSMILIFRGNTIRADNRRSCIFPVYGEWKGQLEEQALIYLFSIDKRRYFLLDGEEYSKNTVENLKIDGKMQAESRVANEMQENCADEDGMGFPYVNVRSLRDTAALADCFAAATGYHLYLWYRDNRFCGRCGERLEKDRRERMLFCPACGNRVYPKIAPAVIVAVTNGDKILMTKYANREYKKYALLAGFCEIGETAEDTVRREVMEEVGLQIKNIRYYKSQPWGFDSNLLLGYFAELDGSPRIVREEEELSAAEWRSREEAWDMDDGISLTREMMGVFARGKEDLGFLDS